MPHNLRRDLGVVESYAALLGILIGAGIFKVTGVAWELTGPSVILGYLVLAPAILATSVAYSVFVSTPLGREPGGEYTHLSRTFGGYGLAFVGAWLKIISYIGALAYLALAFAEYLVELSGGLLRAEDQLAVALAALAFFYAVHVVGVRGPDGASGGRLPSRGSRLVRRAWRPHGAHDFGQRDDARPVATRAHAGPRPARAAVSGLDPADDGYACPRAHDHVHRGRAP